MMSDTEARRTYNAAHAAGMAAGKAAIPQAMTVVDSRRGKFWVEAEGACGFAWVVLPGNSDLGRAWKRLGYASKHYPKGLCVWVSEFNQSLTRKEAYARAFVKRLAELGYSDRIYADSRLD